MNGCNRPVTSREYKLPLNPDRFVDRAEGAARFYELLEFLLRKVPKADCQAQHDEKRRETWYLDTAGLDLDRCGYILRVRDEHEAEGRYKIALKYRHADRYLAASQPIHAGDKFNVKKKDKKFEEDIIPPFISKFSRSVAIRQDAKPEPATVHAAAEFFPILGKLEQEGVLPNAPLQGADKFTAHEVMRYVGRFTLDGTKVPPLPDPNSDVRDPALEACLNFWYLVGENPRELPLVVEFSFNYGATNASGRHDKDDDDNDKVELEEFAPELVEGAEKLYNALQEQTGWILARSTTKTDFALRAM